jgi:hypothetical protein
MPMLFAVVENRQLSLANVAYVESDRIPDLDGPAGGFIEVARVVYGGGASLKFSGEARDKFLAAWRSFTGL